MLTPMVAATAIGPGVGMTMACVVIRPTASAVTSVAKGTRPCRESVLTRLTRMTNAASKKTGMETIYPVSAIAIGVFAVPVTRNSKAAIWLVHPDIWSSEPSATPRTMIIPMPCIVPPKPAAIAAAVLSSGIPARIPMSSPPSNRARNGCSLNLMMDTSTKTSATKKMAKSTPSIISPPKKYYSLRRRNFSINPRPLRYRPPDWSRGLRCGAVH